MTDDDARLLSRFEDVRHATMHRVPGRIEVLGKHTDYAGGRSLLCAANRGFRFASALRGDRRVCITDATSGRRLEIDPANFPLSRGWRVYPETVVRRCTQDFGTDLQGCDIVFDSDLPAASGLSSSSAFIIGTFLALDAANGLLESERGRHAIRTRDDLADYLAAVESGTPFPALNTEAAFAHGVGTRGGSQDHTAILCSVPGSLVRYAFRPTHREGEVRLPENLAFAVAVSGVRASKAGAARDHYNRLSDLTVRIAGLWRAETGGDETNPGEIVRSAPDAAGRLREIVARSTADTTLTRRLEQFIEESEEIVPGAAAALESRDLERFGSLVERSQDLAERLLGNQVPETIGLARTAREHGAVAASAFGAGFGGAVWALVNAGHADDFLEAWRRDYHARFPGHVARSAFFTTPPHHPAGPLPERLGGLRS